MGENFIRIVLVGPTPNGALGLCSAPTTSCMIMFHFLINGMWAESVRETGK